MKRLPITLPRGSWLLGLGALAGLSFFACLERGLFGQAKPEGHQSGIVWEEPKQVPPGRRGAPPSGAFVLFGGKNMGAWRGGEKGVTDKGPPTASSVVTTRQSFGDCQLHVEFAT